jgi:hypothetical protein
MKTGMVRYLRSLTPIQVRYLRGEGTLVPWRAITPGGMAACHAAI